MIENNYKNVIERIDNACRKAGRDRSEVRLIAVSKTKPADDIKQVYDMGQRIFGENKVQELCGKVPQLPEDIEWHLIGHLQQNKVKYLMENTAMIHSVDSFRLAETISKEAQKHNKVMPVLLEINVAEEESKFGIAASEAEEMVRQISALPGVEIRGFMTVAPFVDDPEENRWVFRELKQLCVDINNKNINNIKMNELSMGMTNDFEIAIEEGATFVRVGTAIFGERDYSKIGAM